MSPVYRDTAPELDGERRSVSLNCRVTPTIRSKVDEAAEWAGVEMGTWLRAVVDSALEEYDRLRYGEEEEAAQTGPVAVPAVESSADYETRVRAAAAELRTEAEHLVAPITPKDSKPRSSYRFPDPKDCPHLPSRRAAGGRCLDCGGNIGRYLSFGPRSALRSV